MESPESTNLLDNYPPSLTKSSLLPLLHQYPIKEITTTTITTISTVTHSSLQPVLPLAAPQLPSATEGISPYPSQPPLISTATAPL
eukprot:scaffold382178_cov52-Attheya_sp.AAC.1